MRTDEWSRKYLEQRALLFQWREELGKAPLRVRSSFRLSWLTCYMTLQLTGRDGVWDSDLLGEFEGFEEVTQD